MSVSYTTRPMRPGEVDGVDYHFVDLEKFREMVANNEFLEWAHVFDHRYGTPKGHVNKILASGRDVLFDIDWQGAQQLFQLAGGDVVRVVHPAAVAQGTARAAAQARDRFDRSDRRPHGPRHRRGEPLGRL
jgi:guanylate kinase